MGEVAAALGESAGAVEGAASADVVGASAATEGAGVIGNGAFAGELAEDASGALMSDKAAQIATEEGAAPAPDEKGFFANAWDKAKDFGEKAMGIERGEDGDIDWKKTATGWAEGAAKEAAKVSPKKMQIDDQSKPKNFSPVETQAPQYDAEAMLNALRSRMNQQ